MGIAQNSAADETGMSSNPAVAPLHDTRSPRSEHRARAQSVPRDSRTQEAFLKSAEPTILTLLGGNMITRFEACVHGLVQGVFFRHFTRLTAQKLGITGSVGNQPDGTVRVVAEGPRESLDVFLQWLNHGPELAQVEHLDVEWGQPLSNQTEFSILR